jgi:hypothetical protein
MNATPTMKVEAQPVLRQKMRARPVGMALSLLDGTFDSSYESIEISMLSDPNQSFQRK